MNDRQHYDFVQKVSRYSTTDEMGDDHSGSNQAFDELIMEARKIISQPTAQPTAQPETCKYGHLGYFVFSPHGGSQYSEDEVPMTCPTCGKRIEVVE